MPKVNRKRTFRGGRTCGGRVCNTIGGSLGPVGSMLNPLKPKPLKYSA